MLVLYSGAGAGLCPMCPQVDRTGMGPAGRGEPWILPLFGLAGRLPWGVGVGGEGSECPAETDSWNVGECVTSQSQGWPVKDYAN